jgi:drug/metabolite transporter (DMT)-like permease
LQNLKFGVIEGQYVLAPASAFWLFLASGFFELPKMIETNAFSILIKNPGAFLVASSMGLCVNFLSYLVIQATSSLTMKVLGIVRSIATIMLGAFIYHETISFNEGLGYLIALAGFISYNAAKSGYWDKPNNSNNSSSSSQIIKASVSDDKDEEKGFLEATSPKSRR